MGTVCLSSFHEVTGSVSSSGVIERWELLQARPGSDGRAGPGQLASDLADLTLWLESVTADLDRLQRTDAAVSVQALEAKAKELKVELEAGRCYVVRRSKTRV